jgi:hypothetical protein
MYIIYVFIDCPLCIDLNSLYKPDVLFMHCIYKIIIIIIIIIVIIIIICILLSRLILYCAYCYVNNKFSIHVDGSLEYWINKQ